MIFKAENAENNKSADTGEPAPCDFDHVKGLAHTLLDKMQESRHPDRLKTWRLAALRAGSAEHQASLTVEPKYRFMSPKTVDPALDGIRSVRIQELQDEVRIEVRRTAELAQNDVTIAFRGSESPYVTVESSAQVSPDMPAVTGLNLQPMPESMGLVDKGTCDEVRMLLDGLYKQVPR